MTGDGKAKVLLVLPSDVLDQARVLAGTATTALRLTVSVQIVLRALIEEGLKQSDAPALRDSFDRQARAVRDIRRAVHERPPPGDGRQAASSRPAPSRRRT